MLDGLREARAEFEDMVAVEGSRMKPQRRDYYRDLAARLAALEKRLQPLAGKKLALERAETLYRRGDRLCSEEEYAAIQDLLSGDWKPVLVIPEDTDE